MEKNEVLQIQLYDGTFEGPVAISKPLGGLDVFRTDVDRMDVFREEDAWNQAGIYLLIAQEEGFPQVYVGQASPRRERQDRPERIREDTRDFPEWESVVMITNTANVLDADALNFLEQKFYDVLKKQDGKTLKIVNSKRPEGSTLHRGKHLYSRMVQDTMTILKLMGYSFEEDSGTKGKKGAWNEGKEEREEMENRHVCYPCFYHISPREHPHASLQAKGLIHEDGSMTLLGGAFISVERDKEHAIPRSLQEKLDRYDQHRWILKEDHTFATPSAASGAVRGKTANGWRDWILDHNHQPVDFLRKEGIVHPSRNRNKK